MLLQVLGAAVALVVAGFLLGLLPVAPLQALGAFLFLLGSGALAILALAGAVLLAEGWIFGRGPRWERFN